MADKQVILTRFIGSYHKLDNNGLPLITVFMKRKDEKGLSVWDISSHISKNEELKIFELGDKEYAKKSPYTIGRCDLNKDNIDSIFKKIENKYPNINYDIVVGNILKWQHKEIRFNSSINPALDFHIAQELLNISSYKKRPKTKAQTPIAQ